MSDSDEINPFAPRNMRQIAAAETNTFIQRYPLVKEVLEGPPEDIFTAIQKLSQLPQAERKNIEREHSISLSTITKKLIEQLKKVTNWTIDHDKLFKELNKIMQFLDIDVKTVYRIVILEKIENGLTFMEIYEKVTKLSARMESSSAERNMTTILQRCYKVTRNDAHKEDPDYALYNKRFNCLNEEEKIRYKLKLLKQLSAVPPMPNMPHFDPLNPAPLIPFYSSQNREEFLGDVEKLYSELETTEHDWYFRQLLEIDCPKATEYKKVIASLRLLKQEGEEGKVILTTYPKIKPSLITQAILIQCCLGTKQRQSNILSSGAVLFSNGKVYLKYDISELLSPISFDHIGLQLKIDRDGRVENTNINQEELKKNLSLTLQALYLLIKQACDQSPILFYQDQTAFREIPIEKGLVVMQFCLKMIRKVIQYGTLSRKINLVTQALARPELIIHFSMIQALLLRKADMEKQRELFYNICRTIQEVVMKNQGKMTIMRNEDFLSLFVQTVNRIIEDENQKLMNSQLQSFLINYIPKLFEYGLQIERLNLNKIYELQLATLSANRPRKYRRYMRRMNPFDRVHPDFEQAFGEQGGFGKRDKLEHFMEAFPGSVSYFSEKLSTSVESIQQELVGIDVFKERAPQLQSLLKLFVNEKITSSQSLSTIFKKILNNHPSIFVKESQLVNFTSLKNKLDVKQQQIHELLLALHGKLKQGLAVESITAAQLCQMDTTSNQQMIEQSNMINHLNLLLKMRTKNPAFPYVKELLEISLILQRIESISLNKIVSYQAAYSEQQLKAIKEYYKEEDKNILYFAMVENLKLLSDTCWQAFDDLDIPHINILLKEFGIYFEAMRDCKDRNLVLRVMKKTFRNLDAMAQKHKLNLNFQLYHHNRDIILEVLGSIYKQIQESPKTPRETAIMGLSYLQFVQKCKRNNKEAASQFNLIIIPHLQEAVSELIDFLFFRVRQSKSIFNFREYRGEKNTVDLIRSICCDTVTKIGRDFDISYLAFYNNFVKYVESKALYPMNAQNQQVKILEIQQPANILLPVSKELKEKIFIQAYEHILDKIKEHRYQKSKINTLQGMFLRIIEKLYQKYNVSNQQNRLLTTILQQISENSENNEVNDQIFKIQCSWIDNIIGKVKNFKFENVASIGFINNYRKLILLMLNNPEQYKESIPNSILILQKFLPKTYNENRAELIKYSLNLLELISKVIACSLTFKKVNSQALFNITSALIQSKCPEFLSYIQKFFNVLIMENTNIGSLLSELIQKQSQLASMESDIKGLFLRESQNLVDESQDKISIRLNTFINIFKYKYGEDVAAFSNLTSKFVKKCIKNDDKKEIVYLSYEKKNDFSYSEVLKKDFSQFQPSEHIKVIIKNLLNFSQKQTMKIRLQSLRDVLYYSPLLIPYVMLHPIEDGESGEEFIDFLVKKVASNKSQAVSNFLLFVCLDHSCMVRVKDRTIFFSEYLCYRIIKQIIKSGINKFTLLLTYFLCQLKRFAFLCKLKLDTTNKQSLVDILVEHLKANRQNFFYKIPENNIIYLIMAIIFKQDAVDNLKKCFIPKKNKEGDRQYKIINQSLIPFNVYFRKVNESGRLQSREENIAFTGNLVTPFYPEINEDIYLDEEYKNISKFNYQLQNTNLQDRNQEEHVQKLQPQFLKALASIPPIKKYESAQRQLRTELNERHQNMVSQISKYYLKDQPSLQDNSPSPRDREEEERMMRQGVFRRGGRGAMMDFQRQWGRGRGRGRGGLRRLDREMSRRNRPHISRYAQEDFSPSENAQREQKKTLEKEFQQSLNIIPSQEAIREEESSPIASFKDIQSSSQQLQSLLSEVNDKLFLLGRQGLKFHELAGETISQKKAFLELKDIELDFDYHKLAFQPEQFQQYCLMNGHRFDKLDPTRKQSLRQAQETLYLFNLKRSHSSDSIGHIIDTIDVNYQYLNIPRTLSRSESLSSRGDDFEDEGLQEGGVLLESSQVPMRAFTDLNEELLYEMLLSFYYVCETFASKSFMPFLQNKKSQVKLINTLLQLMKDPFSNKYFPKSIYRLGVSDLKWKEITITQSNLKEEHDLFKERVLAIFQSVKNYSFHQDDNFLLTQIGNEGMFDIIYEPIARKSQENTYVPIYELLEYGFNGQTKQTIISLLKGVKELPENKIDQIIAMLQNSQILPETNEQQHAFVMGRVYQVPRSAQNNFPYENLKEIYKNQTFKTKFRQAYTFGTKDPTPSLLLHLIQSGIYSKQELITFHIRYLASRQEDPRTLNFLNKIINIYTDEELTSASWIKENREIIAKVIEYLNRNSSAQFEKEPISRILRLTNDLGFQIKKAIFVRQITERKRGLIIDYDQMEKRQVTAKLKKGIFESAFQDLRNKPDNFWLSPFSVRFINEDGKRQSGFGDGVKREWFTLLSKAMVNLNYALFKRTSKNNYFFNRESDINPRHLQYFQFIGKLVGFSLAKGSVFISPSLSLILYKMMLGQELTIEDILEDFNEQATAIQSIQNMINQVKTKEDFEAIGVEIPFIYIDDRLLSTEKYTLGNGKEIFIRTPTKTKTILLQTDTEYVNRYLHNEQQQKTLPEKTNIIKVKESVELIPGGSQIFVQFETMNEYLELYKKKVYEIVVGSVKRQFEAFMAGFKRIINPKLISRFTAKELKLLTEGVNTISIDDLQKYTRADIDPMTATLLWGALQKLSNEDRATFLWNWTGVDKMAGEGAKVMGLRLSRSRGPYFIAHACSKHLEVPNCRTEEEMETAVTIAINNVKTGNAFMED